jgi:hypothetical protein
MGPALRSLILYIVSIAAIECNGGPLDYWAWRYPIPPGHHLAAITAGDGKFVAVGSEGTIITSTDGKDWIEHPTGMDIDFKSIAYGKGIYVAVGWDTIDSYDHGAILISRNAIDWKPAINPEEIWGLQGVAYGNGKFVAVGLSGGILTSSDGTNWVQSNNSSDCCSDLEGVCYGKGHFVVAQGGGSMIISADGTNWVEYDTGTAYGFWSIIFGNGYYVASGSYGIIATSTDGINWTNLSSSYPFKCVAFCNGQFIADDGSTSPDGSTWTPASTTFVGYFTGAIWHNGIYVAVGSPASPYYTVPGTSTFTSSNGMDWDSISSEYYKTLAKITHEDHRFVAVGAGGSILSSSNGVIWNLQNSGTVNNLLAVTCKKGIFVAVGDVGCDSNGCHPTILTSRDAINWAAISNVPSTARNYNLSGIAHGDNLFVAVGDSGTILTSQDGVDWFQQASGATGSLSGIAYGKKDGFVAVGEDGTILISKAGTNWTQIPPPSDDDFWEIAYGNGQYVIVANNYNDFGSDIFTSPDGKNWTLVYQLGLWLYGVTYGNGQFLAVGAGFDDAVENVPIYSSPDGINWSSHFSGITGNLYGVTYGNGVFEAVGDFVLESRPIVRLGPLTWLPNGSLQIKLEGESGLTNQIQFSTDLSNWLNLTNFVLTNSVGQFVDPFSANVNHRFYRSVIFQ